MLLRRRLQPSRYDTLTLADVKPQDLPTDLASAHGYPADTLDRLLDAGTRTPGLRALVVVHDGRLVGERVYRGATPDHLLPLNSVTKSVVSLLVAQSLARGNLDLQATVSHLLPEALARVPGSPVGDVTLEQILTGRTGFAFEVSRAEALLNAADPVRLAMRVPRAAPSPSGWTYNDALIGLLSPILQRAEGLNLAALAERELFAPLRIARCAWRRDLRGLPLAYGGLALRPRDLAKIAWLVADGGRWGSRQLVPAGELHVATQRAGPADWRLKPLQHIGYGHLWFTGELHGRSVVWAWGYGGQFMWIDARRRLVAVACANSPPYRERFTQAQRVMGLLAKL